MQDFGFNSWIEISEIALRNNLRFFRNLLSPGTKIAAVIKSNAYGHGLMEMASLSLQNGADLLAVNSIEEAMQIREGYPKESILIMGEIPNPSQWKRELSDSNLWIVVSRLEDIQFYAGLEVRPRIHLERDTGMGRLGSTGNQFLQILHSAKEMGLPIDGIATHFASTEDFQERTYTQKQLDIFLETISRTKDIGFANFVCHASASASTMLFPESHLDMVRIGISLYGLWPSAQTRVSFQMRNPKSDLSLQPVLSWKSRISHIQDLPKDYSIGYGSTYKTNAPTRMAVLPVGYFEGLDRKLSNNGYFLIHGERAPILGRVCMNMTMVDITHIPQARIGDIVTLIGKDRDSQITADDLAEWTGTINYEVVTRIQSDLPRIVIERE